MRTEVVTPRFVEFIPSTLADGRLYISQKYRTAAHKCCCGCGVNIVTPITPTDWSLTVEGDAVTLDPSIGNWNHPCQSHYFIRQNQVVWAGKMSPHAIKRGRDYVQARKDAYFRTDTDAGHQQQPTGSGWWKDFRRWLKSFWS